MTKQQLFNDFEVIEYVINNINYINNNVIT